VIWKKIEENSLIIHTWFYDHTCLYYILIAIFDAGDYNIITSAQQTTYFENITHKQLVVK